MSVKKDNWSENPNLQEEPIGIKSTDYEYPELMDRLGRVYQHKGVSKFLGKDIEKPIEPSHADEVRGYRKDQVDSGE